MVSFIAVGILLYTLPFSIIAVHALREYLKDKEDSKKKHVFYAFASWSVGFTLDLIGALLVAPEMSPARIMVINVLFRLFDAFNVIGLFWLFIFLKDFMPQLKKYIIPTLAYLSITLIVIFATPAAFHLTTGTEYIIDRAEIRNFAIIFFWFLYWGVIAYQFWSYSKLMTHKIAIRRSQTMGIGAVSAILAYVLVITAEAFQSMTQVYLAEIFAILAGVVFYAGFVAPERLRRMWGKQ
ncbi:MAG: hypothetical protein A7315_07300 [Candidatus Altiarchaeales archaeon WOR_SM1_79]|nr:MAG: hypothetical protein A7315_07300 [Candidatus Altiarchaeales archaeon WOR_SM1_79]